MNCDKSRLVETVVGGFSGPELDLVSMVCLGCSATEDLNQQRHSVSKVHQICVVSGQRLVLRISQFNG